MRIANPCLMAFLICLGIMVMASFVHSQEGLTIDERIALVEKKIDSGASRGDIPKPEASRLRTRLSVVKYKRARLQKGVVSEQAYKELDHYLYGLERDAERWSSGLKGR